MNIFFNNKLDKEDVSETNIEKTGTVNTSKYDNICEMLGTSRWTFLDGKQSFIVTAETLVNMQLNSYWAQREKDKSHIMTISQGIKNSRGLYHPIILANIIPRKSFVILDGQHRYDALFYISKKQREEISIQVDVLSFEQDDDEWILQNYEWINTARSISKQDLDDEKTLALIVDQISKKFKHENGRRLIGDYVIKNKQNSKVNIKDLKSEMVKRMNIFNPHLTNPDRIISEIISYNDTFHENKDINLSKIRVGHKVKDECIERKFWLGINFPQWLDEVGRKLD
jgi:hypothetical protein